jgi:hypothetical protein
MANKENPFWKSIRALQPGESKTARVHVEGQLKSWRSYVSNVINKKRPNIISVTYDASTEHATFRCILARVEDMFEGDSLVAYKKAKAGLPITTEQYELVKRQMQQFLNNIKPLIEE